MVAALHRRASRPGLDPLTETLSHGSVDPPEALLPGAAVINRVTSTTEAIAAEVAWEDRLRVDQLLGRVIAVSGPTITRAVTTTTAVNRTSAATVGLLHLERPLGTRLLLLRLELNPTGLIQDMLRWLPLQDWVLLRRRLLTT